MKSIEFFFSHEDLLEKKSCSYTSMILMIIVLKYVVNVMYLYIYIKIEIVLVW